MRAAKNFSYGDGKKSHLFMAGDEIPDTIAELLDDKYILEKMAVDSPDALSRDQLMRLAGVGEYAAGEGEEGDAPSEVSVLNALTEFDTKGDLQDWFHELYPDDADLIDKERQSREVMEQTIVDYLTADEE